MLHPSPFYYKKPKSISSGAFGSSIEVEEKLREIEKLEDSMDISVLHTDLPKHTSNYFRVSFSIIQEEYEICERVKNLNEFLQNKK